MVRICLVLIGLSWGAPQALADDIVLLGDSQVGGFGPRLSRRLREGGHRVRVVYRNGWTAQRFRLSGIVPAAVHGADLVVVCLGGNNRQAALVDYRRSVEALIVQLKQARVTDIVWLGPAYSANAIRQARKQRTEEFQLQLLPPLGVTYVSTQEATRGLPLRQDQIHFTPAGYSAWARVLFDQLSFILVYP